jgi:hypothetical protein
MSQIKERETKKLIEEEEMEGAEPTKIKLVKRVGKILIGKLLKGDVNEKDWEELFSKIKLEELMFDTTLNVKDIKEEDQHQFLVACISYCINGPVTMNQTKNLPILGLVRTKDFVNEEKFTGGKLRSFCEIIAKSLKMYLGDKLKKCTMIRLKGDLWPLFLRKD